MIDELKQRLQAEVERLNHEINFVLPKEIEKARAHGDLRENSEYKAALERQQFAQARASHLRLRLSKLSSVKEDDIPRDRVGFGSRVTVQISTRRSVRRTPSRSVNSSRGTTTPRSCLSRWPHRSARRCSAARSVRPWRSRCRWGSDASRSSSSRRCTTSRRRKSRAAGGTPSDRAARPSPPAARWSSRLRSRAHRRSASPAP